MWGMYRALYTPGSLKMNLSLSIVLKVPAPSPSPKINHCFIPRVSSTICRRLILLAAGTRPPPVEHLATELGILATEEVGHVVVVEGRQAGHLILSHVRGCPELVGPHREPGIVGHFRRHLASVFNVNGIGDTLMTGW